uniref:Protein JASON n=1 Tax=Noccaea caerulescens TaxID=107243 RepID=A0A1J3FYW5_NOCCA
MGCFLGCFGGRKNRRRQKRRESDQAEANKLSVESAKPDHLNDRVHAVEEIPKNSVISVTEICDEDEEKCCPSPTRKRVTFDSKVKTYEHIVLQESVELLEEEKEEVKPEEVSLNSSKPCQSSSENGEVASNSSGSYPSNHRYKNCRESDDEIEDDELDCGEGDLDEEDEYCSDDAFSEDTLHNQTKEVYTEEIDAELRGSNECVRDGNHYAQGVLSPVENLSQWKSAKSKGIRIQKQSEKENSNLISDHEDKRDISSFGVDPRISDTTLSFNLKSRIDPKKPRNEESTVDASLSTWLSTSETGSECNSVSITPEKTKSSYYSKRVTLSHDDRPVLCALTMEEIKRYSATSTPRKSSSKSLDETPIIGTVGGYWGNHLKAIDCGSPSTFKGIPNTTSKYREDKSVNWHSTPFEARLEKALNNKNN